MKHARPSRHEVDEVVVERILGGDWALAKSATVAERQLVCEAWARRGEQERIGRTVYRGDGMRYTMRHLARMTGWRPDRYYRFKDQEAA